MSAVLATETVPVAQLEHYPANPRVGDVGAIAASLRAHGQYRALVVNRPTMQVLAGNHTLKALREIGTEEVLVHYVDVDAEEAARIVLVDNRSNDLAGYNDEALARLLQGLPDLGGTGYDQAALDDLLASLAPPPQALTDPDDVPEPPAEPITKRGDLWLLGEHRLLCGDSTEKADVGRLMAGRLADMVWTDPPYGVNVTGGTHDPRDKANYGKGRKVVNDALSEQDTERLWREAAGATAAACRAGAVWYSAAPARPLHLRFARVLDDLGILRQMLVWVKSNFVFGRSDYHYRHEPIMYGWVPGADHHEPPSRDQDTVWEFDRPGRDLSHPTMKPVALVARAVANSSAPGDAILDPFVGSGTTLIAAHQEGRRGYGLEIDPTYCDVICKRFQQHTGILPRREDGTEVDFT